MLRKALIFATFIVSPLSANSATINWNFDENPSCSAFVCNLNQTGYVSNGFVLTGIQEDGGAAQTFAYRGSASLAFDGSGLLTSTRYSNLIRKNDGSTFDIKSLVFRGSIDLSYSPKINLILTAEYEDGSIFQSNFRKDTSWNNYEDVAIGEWTNIVSLTIDDDGYYSGNQIIGYEYDSIVFSEVPIPTAAWLFSSALISLIGIKRKRYRHK